MCPPYQPPKHGSVDICESVQAGTRVTISCDTYFMAYGEETGGRRSPKCLPDGSYEKGIECIPRPCPKKNKIPMPEDEPCDSEAHALEAHPPAVKISHHQIKDWEQGLQRQDVYDYTPNVFDHEPRPYQIPQVTLRLCPHAWAFFWCTKSCACACVTARLEPRGLQGARAGQLAREARG